jgi:hypothetical protein
MGYDVHITRKNNWFERDGATITLEEWNNYVTSDPEMSLEGFAEATTPDGSVVKLESPGLSLWTAYSGQEKNSSMAWFHHFEDRVSVKNPDEEILIKMYSIASLLNAKVQGDDSEVYDSNGQSNWQELRQDAESAPDTNQTPRPWWKLWG